MRSRVVHNWFWMTASGQTAVLPSSWYCVPAQNLLVVCSNGLYWLAFTPGCTPRVSYWAPSPILGPGQQTCRRPSTHTTQKQQRTDGPGSGTPQQPQGSHTPCNNS
ncbi:hypothetical protein ILYODFUR_033040 [Ilyodon furcidens]|uniref:Uncharacterized protein n=1 Tax=Ilyodon furcidens TaxID=33524 RepID=A0ABV0VA06_9TELE